MVAEWGENASFAELTSLFLDSNPRLHGSIPSWGGDGSMINLQVITMANTSLTGVPLFNMCHVSINVN